MGGRGEREKREGRIKVEEREREGKEGKKFGDKWKIVFWNVAGLYNKDENFWKKLGDWEVVVLSETWIEEKDGGE